MLAPKLSRPCTCGRPSVCVTLEPDTAPLLWGVDAVVEGTFLVLSGAEEGEVVMCASARIALNISTVADTSCRALLQR
jgi:hypothetical protein